MKEKDVDMASPRKRNRQDKNGVSKRSKQDDDVRMTDVAATPQTALIDLQRLLKAMEDSPEGPSHEVESRATLCRQLFEATSNPTAALQQRVDAACERAAQIAQAAATSTNGDAVQNIFFKSNEASATSAAVMAEPTGSPTDTTATSAVVTPQRKEDTRNTVLRPTATSVATLQQQQREQMESAVSQMASQMKEQTTQLHATLQSQTDNLLDAVEDVTAQNVEDVAQVAAATQEQVRKNWRRTAATWTLLLTVLAAFIGTLLTIYTVPKAPCLLYCGYDNQFCRMVNGVQECVDGPVPQKQEQDTPPDLVQEEESDEEEEEIMEPVEDEVVIETPEPEVEVAETPEPIEEEVFEPPEPTDEEADPVHDEYHQENTRETEEVQEPPEEEVQVPPAGPIYRMLSRAAATGDLDLLRYHLRKNPGFVHTQDANGWGLIHESARSGYLEIVELLISLGADPWLTTNSDETPLDLARQEFPGHPVSKFLERLMGEAEEDEEEEEEEVDPPQPEAQAPIENGKTREEVEIDPKGGIQIPVDAEALREAALREFAEMQAKESASSFGTGAAMNQQQKDDGMMGGDPFGEAKAVPLEDIPMFEGKPFSGKELRRAASRGDTPRMAAYLEKNPPFLNQPDQNGWTALHLAVRAGNTDVVELLLDAGADIEAVTLQGRTVMDMAILKFGNEPHPIIDMLEEYE